MEIELILGIGDLHGHFIALKEILDAAQKRYNIFSDERNLKLDPKSKIVFTGDYIDRGDHGLAIIEFLIRLKEANPNNVETLFGNHELLALAGLNAAKNALEIQVPQTYQMYSVHGQNGGMKFVREFGTDDNTSLKNYVERMSRDGDIGSWMRQLKPGIIENICNKRVMFVHGGVPPRAESALGIENELKKITQHIQTPTAKFFGSEKKYLDNDVVGARSVFWDRSFTGISNVRAIEVTKNIGVDYIIIGHTPNRDGQIKSYGDRIFDIDIAMCPAYGARTPGGIVFNRKGIFGLYAGKDEVLLTPYMNYSLNN